MEIDTTAHTLSPDARKTLLRIIIVSSFLPPFMGSALNVALPEIGRIFSLSAVAVGWVNSIYLLTTVTALVPAGRIADIHGRRKVFLAGLTLFTLTCLLCAVAPSAEFLIAARGLLGIGAAMIFATITAILTSAFPTAERGKVLGINIAAVYAGLSGGPVLGGLMTEYFGWRSIFLANIPVGLWVIAAIHRQFKQEWADASGESLDVPGTVLYGVALSALMYGVSCLPTVQGIVLTAMGVICLTGFVRRERRIAWPVLDVGLLTHNRIFRYSNLAALIHYSATFAVGFLLSLYLQIVRGFPADQTGLILIAQPVVQAVFSPLAGRLSDRFEPRLIASIGMTITCVGLAVLIPLHAETPVWQIVAILAVLGFGFAFFASPNANAVMGAVEKNHYGTASGVLATARQIGQMLSMTLAMLVFSLFIGSVPLARTSASVLIASISTILTVMVLLCILGIFASLARGNQRGAKGHG